MSVIQNQPCTAVLNVRSMPAEVKSSAPTTLATAGIYHLHGAKKNNKQKHVKIRKLTKARDRLNLGIGSDEKLLVCVRFVHGLYM